MPGFLTFAPAFPGAVNPASLHARFRPSTARRPCLLPVHAGVQASHAALDPRASACRCPTAKAGPGAGGGASRIFPWATRRRCASSSRRNSTPGQENAGPGHRLSAGAGAGPRSRRIDLPNGQDASRPLSAPSGSGATTKSPRRRGRPSCARSAPCSSPTNSPTGPRRRGRGDRQRPLPAGRGRDHRAHLRMKLSDQIGFFEKPDTSSARKWPTTVLPPGPGDDRPVSTSTQTGARPHD